MDKQYDKRTRRTWRRPKSGNTYRFTQNDTKKYPTGKRQAMMEYMATVQKILLHSRQTSTRNEQMLTRSISTRQDDERKDHIDPKGPSKGTAPNNYRLITCLLMMWKISIAQIREEIYYSLTSRRLFPENRNYAEKDRKAQQNYFT